MQTYIKKPVSIQAIQWTGENLKDVISFINNGGPDTNSDIAAMNWERYCDIVNDEGLKIHTLEGTHNADIGDYIIKGVKGEHYPCKPEIFKMTYFTQEEYAAL